jgi:prophage tail gpP-like protein
MIKNDVRLTVGEMSYAGFESFSNSDSLDDLSCTMQVDIFARRTLGAQLSFLVGSPEAIVGQSFSLSVVNRESNFEDSILEGLIVNREREDVKDGPSMCTIFGADDCIDLTQCSAFHKTNYWRQVPLTKIVRDLIKPYSRVKLLTSTMKDDPIVEDFSFDMGDSVFSIIERLCRAYGFLVVSRGGRLEIGYAADSSSSFSYHTDVALTELNIRRIREQYTIEDVYSDYIGFGQDHGRGRRWARTAAPDGMLTAAQARAVDKTIDRYRPLIMVATTRADRKILQKKINWEAQVRNGRAKTYTIEVVGFYPKEHALSKQSASLWRKNTVVPVYYPDFDLDRELLITGVERSLSDQGELTRLTLRDPSVFAPDPSDTITRKSDAR